MLRFIINRILQLIPVMVIMSLIVFFLMHLIPGDPVDYILGLNATEERRIALRTQLGLDKNLAMQYLNWAGNMLTGDFGKSVIHNRPVFATIIDKMPATLLLSLSSIIISVILALFLGTIAAARQGTKIDLAALIMALFWVSIPGFWLALLLIFFFSLTFPILPSMGYASPFTDFIACLRYLFMPMLCLALATAGGLTRMIRSEMIEQLNQDYITTAWAKGLTERAIIYKHALKNAMLPVITIIGMLLGYSLGGTVIIEQIFSWPGIGRTIINAVQSRDYPMVQGATIFLAFTFVLVNLIVDISYTFLNPKIRIGKND